MSAPSASSPACPHRFKQALPGDASLLVVELDSHGSGEDLLPELVSLGLSGRTMILAEAFTEPTAFQLLRFGVKGIVTYREASQHLPRILREVIAGGLLGPESALVAIRRGHGNGERPPPTRRADVGSDTA